jgi:transposase
VCGPRVPPVGKLELFKPYLQERLRAGVWNARVLLRKIRERNYDGGYMLLTDWLRPQRQQAESLAVRRFETPPGNRVQWIGDIWAACRMGTGNGSYGTSP